MRGSWLDETFYKNLISDNEQSVLVIDDPVIYKMRMSKILKEIRKIILQFIPLSTCFVLTYFPNVLNLYFIAKTHNLEEISILGTTIVILNMTGFFFINSVNQEIGNKIASTYEKPNLTNYYNKYTVGLYIHRGIVFETVFMAIWFIILLSFTYNLSYLITIKNSLFFEEKLTSYLICILPSLYFNMGFDLIRNLMTSLNMLYVPSSFMVLTIFFHFIICFFMKSDYRLTLNVSGCIKDVTDFLNTFLILLYALNLITTKRILSINWTKNSFRDLVNHLKFAEIFKNYIILSSYEIMHIIALLYVDVIELAPYFVIISIQNMNLLINRGFGKVIEITIRKAVKDCCCNKVKNQTILGIVLSLLLAICQYFSLFVLGSFVTHVILKDRHSILNFEIYCKYYGLKIFLDAIVVTLEHSMKGLKKQNMVFYLHIFIFFGLQITLFLLMVSNDPNFVISIWKVVLFCESFFIALNLLYFVFVLDWNTEINRIGYKKLKEIINTI
jgi:Na+-driven multidrug efflux pump